MSSSGLIYAVIVGAWAAYLVPMWLRRQDELNEARPTERFSTAIRLLSGRAGLERRASRSLEGEQQAEPSDAPASSPAAPPPPPAHTTGNASAHTSGNTSAHTSGNTSARAPESQRRAALLARRRRMVILLFAAFTAGMVTAAVGGVGLLWVPAVPAVLFSLYISHLRRQERRRFEVKLDRRRSAEAAQRLRERERERDHRHAEPPAAEPASATPRPADLPHADYAHGDFTHAEFTHPGGRGAADPGVLVEAADPDEWADATQESPEEAEPGSWDPVPVPLPTYVTAPVAPRRTSGLDLGGPDTWSAGRAVTPPPADTAPARPAPRPPSTPLFDQYAEDDPRPRAANE
ncbi:hypothetical protein GXW83_30865 [Streptacidiphilus sp. PB12-B1b]|uniref:divisome protein SepX/GlpR n=1 Tax=Streptacidiphilus sp. PB12-B1b TaxID=2705012 RepID=UPI0015FD3977|nr:hypothetical protein [Streptacidiphilus sp. PB12-B1b]QMU79454.1 hypothetical protein GXW83_30865 [Streptacidiphilus sp. PB12-B1b]